MSELLRVNDLSRIDVRGAGSCEDIHLAAKAMVHVHPTYYFLVDRDGYDDEFIKRSWANFPNTSTHNLLVWPRRELENYFIDPEYLAKSEYLVRSSDVAVLRDLVLGEARARLYVEAVNLVLLQLRYTLRRPLAASCALSTQVVDRASAIEHLRRCQPLERWQLDATAACAVDVREQKLDEALEMMTGGRVPLEYGRGRWLELIAGKEILHAVANHPCLVVRGLSGAALQGREKLRELVKGLLRLPIAAQPADLQRLLEILRSRLT